MFRNAFLRAGMGAVVLMALSAVPGLAQQSGAVDPARQTMKQKRQAKQQNADAAKESQASSQAKSESPADTKAASAEKTDSKTTSEAKPASDTKTTSEAKTAASDKSTSENKSTDEHKGEAGSKQDPAAVPDLARPGRDIGAGKKACQKGDTSPAGTVRDGMKKVIVHLPIGQNCRWEPQ